MKTYPTIRSVNVLYLVAMVLVLTVGSSVQVWSPGWGLIVTELGLILLPALIVLRWQRLAPRETLRLRWPGWRVAGLSLLLGAGAWLVASWVGVLVSLLMGYSTPTPPGFFPVTPGRAVITFVGLALCAPVCEEVMFRGLIQRAYQRLGPAAALLVTAGLFILFHQSFQGLFSLVPVALALGYVVQRSRSLVSGVLVHFANNALASGLIVAAGLRPDLSLGLPSMLGALAGVALVGVGLWGLRRATGSEQAAKRPPVEAPLPVEAGGWLARTWPLAVAALLFGGVAAAEVVTGRFPRLWATESLSLPPSPWTEPTQWLYAIRNPLGETIGQTECALTPAADTVTLRCQGHHRAFESRQGASYYKAGEGEVTMEWVWRRTDQALLAGTLTAVTDGVHTEAVAVTDDGARLQVTSGTEVKMLALPPNALLPQEWPWRAAALPLSVGYGRTATLAWPHQWDPETETNPPGLEATLLLVQGVEPFSGPSGPLEAWHVTVGSQQAAWYAVDAPHTLLRYEDGMFSYVLIGETPAGSGRELKLRWLPRQVAAAGDGLR